MPALDTRVRLWTVAVLVATGTTGLARIRSFAERADSLPPVWKSWGAAAAGVSLAAGTLLLLLLVVFWKRLEDRHLLAATVALGLLIVAAPAVAKTAGRLRLGPKHMVLDSILQVEVAAGMLERGRNPYREDYFGTEMEEWHGGRHRFPMRHLVYPPVPLLVTVPARAFFLWAFGGYDSRFLLIPGLVGAFIACLVAWRGNAWRPLLLAAAFMNPLILSDLHVGRWDTLILVLWVCAGAAWRRGRWGLVAALFGLMAGIKLTFLAAGAFGFVAAAVDRRRALRWAAAWAPAFLLPLIPFLVWDAPAIVEDLVTAPLGLRGHPLLVVDAGPFGGGWVPRLLGGRDGSPGILPGWLLQIPATLAVAFMAGWEVWRRRTPASVGMATAITVATFFYFGSYSDPSYFGFLLSMAAVSLGFDRIGPPPVPDPPLPKVDPAPPGG